MLRIYAIFSSIQGESTYAGLPCGFVRFAGCPLHCTYCDTRDACDANGREMTVDDIIDQVKRLGLGLVEVTGGEPLAQSGAQELLSALCDNGYHVLLETSGAFPIDSLDGRVRVIMDVKCPGSGMSDRICWENFDLLTRERHELKFVVASRSDFDWAVNLIRSSGLTDRAALLVSPVLTKVALPDLATWIMNAGLPLRLQVQLHKIIWQNPGTNQ